MAVVQVKASELTQSSAFATSVTLRFPRVEDIRYDKEWHECVTTAQLEDLATVSSVLSDPCGSSSLVGTKDSVADGGG